MANDLAEVAPDGLAPLVECIRARCGPALRAVVLYGSTRRNANVHDGLVDLMVIVDDYRAMHGTGMTAMLNYLLPPNVYYLEAGPENTRVRCKYIIVSEATFMRRTAGGLDGYFWARFSQPCRLIWARRQRPRPCGRSPGARRRHFATQALALGNGRLAPADFWVRAVSATYRCELRPEPPGAAQALIARDPAFWTGLSRALFPSMSGISAAEDGAFRIDLSRGRRISGRLRWALRRLWSKTLNVLRLLKAAGTFANGVDYLSWKIERHSGSRSK